MMGHVWTFAMAEMFWRQLAQPLAGEKEPRPLPHIEGMTLRILRRTVAPR